MIRLSWLQFRTQAAAAVGLLAVAAVLLGVTGPHVAHLVQLYFKAQAACIPSQRCVTPLNLSTFDRLLELLGSVLVVVPGLLGAFWGAPLVARELESGTFRLAWTQSVSRTRWLGVKLAVAGLASVAVTGLLSLMVTWWSSPLDRVSADRFGLGLFGERNVAPLGYAAFAFALGVTAGLLLRRTLPAMATTLVAFLGARLAFTYWIRPHLLGPAHLSLGLSLTRGAGYGSYNGGPNTLVFAPPNLPNAWIYSNDTIDKLGHQLTPQVVAATCPKLTAALGGPPPASQAGVTHPVPGPAGAKQLLRQCFSVVGRTYHHAITFQPASRYWTFQWLEMSIYLAAALILVAGCIWWLRHRIR